MQEIERKFLVNSEDFKNEAHKSITIAQGFLNSDKSRTVRVRITDDEAFLTIKGPSSESGLTRLEWETDIPQKEAKALFDLCEPGQIEKTRFYIEVDQHVWEVDEFYGSNEGLIVAEIELSSEDEKFQKPDWLGEEVTGQPKYYNSMLSKAPFKSWK